MRHLPTVFHCCTGDKGIWLKRYHALNVRFGHVKTLTFKVNSALFTACNGPIVTSVHSCVYTLEKNLMWRHVSIQKNQLCERSRRRTFFCFFSVACLFSTASQKSRDVALHFFPVQFQTLFLLALDMPERVFFSKRKTLNVFALWLVFFK